MQEYTIYPYTHQELYDREHPAGDISIDPEDIQAQKEYDQETLRLKRLAEQKVGRHFNGDEQAHYLHRAKLVVEALGDSSVPGESRYTLEDVLSWVQMAVDMGAPPPKFGPGFIEDLRKFRRVPNAVFRDAIRALATKQDDNSPSLEDIALRAGLSRTKPNGKRVGDRYNLLRLVGLEPFKQPGNPPYVRLFISYDQALALADVLGIDYRLAGI